ncbi:MAG: hypothetical protein ACI88A_001470 [Paraglaciecola sp.]
MIFWQEFRILNGSFILQAKHKMIILPTFYDVGTSIKRHFRPLSWIMSFVFIQLITAFQTARAESFCQSENIKIDWQFESGAISECQFSDDGKVRLSIKPENLPINSSPWYAFSVSAKEPESVNITLLINNGKPRYLPKRSTDKKTWQPVTHQIEQDKLIFSINATKEKQYVAGQELLVSDYYQDWFSRYGVIEKNGVSKLGESTQGRAVYAMQRLALPESKEWLIILGRQHPPEVTGAMALLLFVDELLLNSPLNQQFLKRFNLLVIPLLNPDGVAAGNWRHNANGIDLNRDWVYFSQKETQLVKTKLDEITSNGGKIVFAIDFHSTWNDVFYTMPTDYGIRPAMFVEHWLNTLAEQVAAQKLDFEVIQKPGSSPGKGVFKQFIADTYGVHAITYEMGDNTDRLVIKQVAQLAASNLMSNMLELGKDQF